MKQSIFTVKSNQHLTDTVLKMVSGRGYLCHHRFPGQFVNIKLDGFFLRRPISVCDYNEKTLTILYKVVGKGTQYLSTLAAGKQLDILTGLGNGYDTSKSGMRPLLIGGGVGVPPMYRLAKNLLEEGKKPEVILGFNTKAEAFYIDEFRALGVPVQVATADGPLGTKGFVTDVVKTLKDYTYFYTCGPEPMLKALSDVTERTSVMAQLEENAWLWFRRLHGMQL